MLKDEDKIVKVAMEIVIAAGDARLDAGRALDCLERFDFEEAKQQLKKARENITRAHHAQTAVIQGEIAGEEEYEPSLLFNHAQDTLMTIMTEVSLAERMVRLFEAFDERYEGKQEKREEDIRK